MNKKNGTKIDKAAWGCYLHSLINGLITKRGLDGYDVTDDHWDCEEHEDYAGTYWVQYYAKSEQDAAEFGKIVVATAKRRGWNVEDDNANWAEAVESMGVEKRGKHKGRVLVYWYVKGNDARK